MVVIYVEFTPESKNEEPLIIFALAWSHGLSRNIDSNSLQRKVVPRDPVPEFNVYPKDWSADTVTAWLKANNLKEIASAFANEITGKELFHVTSEQLKELDVGALQRIRYTAAIAELTKRWAEYTPSEQVARDEELHVQDISVTAYMDDRAFRLVHALMANRTFRKATLTVYHGQRRRHGRNQQPQLDEDENDPRKVRSFVDFVHPVSNLNLNFVFYYYYFFL
jgi:hypothetical protein